jgi:hypothetical protein
MAESLPDFLTIEEAARVLRLGRTAAYEQARVWRDTDGKAGLPNFAIGHALRVPTAALENLLGRPLSAIPAPRRREASRSTAVSAPPEEGQIRELRPRTGVRRRPRADSTQGALPL